EDDENFVKNFQQLDVRLNESNSELLNPILLVKPGQKSQAWERDSISGATVSSRAVADILVESTAFWLPLLKQHQEAF
ncbi:hypothetical protein DF186_24805, partial [Enterococcus hirae]